MTVARLLIAAPIPSIDSWIVAAELPPGYMVLRSIIIKPRSAGKTPGTSLVRADDVSDLERLAQAFGRCDAAGRAELLKIAEVLAGASP